MKPPSVFVASLGCIALALAILLLAPPSGPWSLVAGVVVIVLLACSVVLSARWR